MATTALSPAEQANVRAAAGVNDAMLAIGRVLIAIIYIASGAQKFMGLSEVAAQLASKGFPMPSLFAIGAAALELGGGILIVIGWQTRIFALALAIFTAIAAYFFHDFWHLPPGMEKTDNMIHFMKNVSMMGGFLMLCAAGAGRYSLDGSCVRPEYLK